MGFTKIILEGDSLTVIKKLQTHSQYLFPISNIIEESKIVCSRFECCHFSHVRKSANGGAHLLAKHGLREQGIRHGLKMFLIS
ncbi:hypothetical protein REPUB_Repub16aG0015400 [Reevesia pubescens]